MSNFKNNLEIRINKKIKELNKLRPLPVSMVEKLKEQFQVEMAYNSNAIEGNNLTLKETFLVIEEGITIKGKSLRDHLEAKDHKEALDYLYDLVEKEQSFSEVLMRNLHELVMQKTDKEWAGKYRDSNVLIVGSKYIPPSAFEVPIKMQELTKWIRINKKKMHIVELVALVHHKITYIHPFSDGNGRMARLIMNLLLMQKGYPLAVILKNDRKKYYNTLSKADKNNVGPFVNFVARAVERSLDIYLKTFSSKEKFLSLSQISKKTPYSAKYLNLLARQGKLEAHKQGREWVTTEQAVKRYIENRERKRDLNE